MNYMAQFVIDDLFNAVRLSADKQRVEREVRRTGRYRPAGQTGTLQN